eukprot:symbB.v1.2.021087.t1/scaffold1805.1/size100715/6
MMAHQKQCEATPTNHLVGLLQVKSHNPYLEDFRFSGLLTSHENPTVPLQHGRLAGSKADIEAVEPAAFGFRFEDLFKLGQEGLGVLEVIDEGTSEEYNIYGDSDTELPSFIEEDKFLQRQAEAQKIIAQERERMEGGVFGRMRKGVTAGGARERAARRKGKRGEAKDASPAPSSAAKAEKKVENTSVSPRRTPTTSAAPPSLFGFNFELLAFGQDWVSNLHM